ncbi:unnamed protein product [Protopolystoma xenopodis]|uniref:Uncharacterized protein n=1 Tax=Protopolystoma xenopodis TaxID=117903 RepID=A0A3S5A3B2_9PLAT|nr:unnamed protein product [Protopolystoma xenopodis]
MPRLLPSPIAPNDALFSGRPTRSVALTLYRLVAKPPPAPGLRSSESTSSRLCSFHFEWTKESTFETWRFLDLSTPKTFQSAASQHCEISTIRGHGYLTFQRLNFLTSRRLNVSIPGNTCLFGVATFWFLDLSAS